MRTRFFTPTPDREVVENPRHLGKSLKKLGTQQRAVSCPTPDVGWGALFDILCGKAESAGRGVIPVSPQHTSQHCNRCGHEDEAQARAVPSSKNGGSYVVA